MSAYMRRFLSRRFFYVLHFVVAIFHGRGVGRVLPRDPGLVRGSHQLISGSSDPACHNAACMDPHGTVGWGKSFGRRARQADMQPRIRPANRRQARWNYLLTIGLNLP